MCSLHYSSRHLTRQEELRNYLQVARSCYGDRILHKAPGSGGHLQGADPLPTNSLPLLPMEIKSYRLNSPALKPNSRLIEKCQNPAYHFNEMLARRGGAGLSPAPSGPRMTLSVTSSTPSGARRSLWSGLRCLVHGTRSKPSRPVGQVGLAPRALGCSEGSWSKQG